MKNIIDNLVIELQKAKYQNAETESEYLDDFLRHTQRFLLNTCVSGKKVKITSECIYKGHVLAVKHVYTLPNEDSPASYRLDLTGTKFEQERGYKDTVMWETNFEWTEG